MPPFRTPSLRYLLGRSALSLRLQQRRWARVHDVRFLATHGIQERILDRYKNKLDQKAKEEGVESISDLKSVYKDRINSLRKQAAVPGATGPLRELKKTAFPHPPPRPAQPAAASVSEAAEPKSSSPFAPPGVKTLSSYLDVEKTLTLPLKEIEVIWRLRHSNNPQSLCAVIPNTTFIKMSTTARQHPQFILPLPREGAGAEIHFLQWTWPHKDTVNILFTHLAEYKLRGEYATPHTTVTLHTELMGEKGVVLAQGSVQDNRGVSVEEAKWLLMCVQKFYGFEGDKASETRKNLMEQFSRGDEKFNVEQLLEEAERI